MYKTKEEVENWLITMEIKDYIINEDLSVDVKSDTNLYSKNLTEIPIYFREVEGNFYCNWNELTTLEGCPKIVKGNFYCDNNKLTTLFGCPEIVTGNFECHDNNLTNLKSSPKVINSVFHCSTNKLTSLEGCPEVINGNFYCNNNQLTDLKYFPKEIKGFLINIMKNNMQEEELKNFNCNTSLIISIYSDFSTSGNKEEFLNKVGYYKSKNENKLLKELNNNMNTIKLNKKL